MSLESIISELDDMEINYQVQTVEVTNETTVEIPMQMISGPKARQIEYLCTSNNGIVSKEDGVWVVSQL